MASLIFNCKLVEAEIFKTNQNLTQPRSQGLGTRLNLIF